MRAKQVGKNLEARVQGGAEINMEVFNYNPQKPFMVLYRPRRTNQGHMQDQRETKPIPLIEGQYIKEPTYFHFFSHNIVGFLYHRDGPRPRRLTEYINKKFGAKLSLIPIYRTDLDAALREMSMQYLEITIPSNQATTLTADQGAAFANPLSAAGQLLHDGSISLRIMMGRGGNPGARRQRRETLLERALAFVGLEDHSAYAKAKAVGSNSHNSSFSVDLLEHRFVHKVVVESEDFVPGQTKIRDNTPYIINQWEIDRSFLNGVVPQLASNEEDVGLLGAFRESPSGQDAEDTLDEGGI